MEHINRVIEAPKINSNFFPYYMVVLYFLISLYSLFQNHIFYISFILLFYTLLIFLDRKSMIILLLGTIPLYSGFSYISVLIIGLVLYCIKYLSTININSSIILVFVLLLWELLHFFLLNLDIAFFLKFSIILLWIVLIASDGILISQLDITKLVFYFTTSLILLSILIFIEFQSEIQLSNFLQSGFRLGTLQFGDSIFNVNPNTLTLYAIVGLSIQVCIAGFKTNYIRVILIIATVFIGILTYSRTFIFSSIFILLSIFFSKSRINIRAVIIIILFIGVIFFQYPYLIDNVNQRFMVEDLSNSRIEIFNLYNDYISAHPSVIIFGVGLQNYQSKVGLDVSIHNPIQEIIVTWGIIGLAMVVIFIIFIMKAIFNSGDYNIRLLPLITYCITIQSSRLLTTPINLLLLLLVIVSCITKENKSIGRKIDEKGEDKNHDS